MTVLILYITDVTIRRICVLLIGLIWLFTLFSANLVHFSSNNENYIVAATFRNSSLSYVNLYKARPLLSSQYLVSVSKLKNGRNESVKNHDGYVTNLTSGNINTNNASVLRRPNVSLIKSNHKTEVALKHLATNKPKSSANGTKFKSANQYSQNASNNITSTSKQIMINRDHTILKNITEDFKKSEFDFEERLDTIPKDVVQTDKIIEILDDEVNASMIYDDVVIADSIHDLDSKAALINAENIKLPTLIEVDILNNFTINDNQSMSHNNRNSSYIYTFENIGNAAEHNNSRLNEPGDTVKNQKENSRADNQTSEVNLKPKELNEKVSISYKSNHKKSSSLSQQYEHLEKAVSNQTSNTAKIVSNRTTGIANTVSNLTSGTANTMSNLTSGTANTVSNLTSGIANTVSNLTSGTANTVSNLTSGIANTVSNRTSDIANKVPPKNHTNNGSIKTANDSTTMDRFIVEANCSRRVTGVEDVLCMKRPQFLPDFLNPCWYQGGILKCLPYFHIIGVCKTGTTDLFKRLSHHPQILKNRGLLGKETWYWTWRRYGHCNFYRSATRQTTFGNFIDHFDAKAVGLVTRKQSNGSLYHPAVTGHGDPMDFWDHSSWKRIPQNDPSAELPEVNTPSLIKHVNPNVKLILILRDPIESPYQHIVLQSDPEGIHRASDSPVRLFSNYLHGPFGSTANDFHKDVLTSLSVLDECTRNRSLKSCLYDEYIIRSLKVPISGSFYSVHIKEWLKVFPRNQIYISRTQDLAKNIADTLLGIFRFLKLDPLPTKDLYRIANMPHYYNTKARETAGNIRAETRDILRSLFEPYNTELTSILHDDKFNFNNVS